MSTRIEAVVGYLAGDGGGNADRLRAELEDPSSEASRFLEVARQLSRSALGAAVLRRMTLFPGAPGASDGPLVELVSAATEVLPPGSRPARQPRRAFGRVAPWVIALVSCVLIGLLWRDVREQCHRLEATLTNLDRRLSDKPAPLAQAPGTGTLARVVEQPHQGVTPVPPVPRTSPTAPASLKAAEMNQLVEALARRLQAEDKVVREVAVRVPKGVPSRDDLARLEKQLARIELALAALARTVARHRPVTAQTSEGEKRTRALLQQELQAMRTLLREDLRHLCPPGEGKPAPTRPGASTPLPPLPASKPFPAGGGKRGAPAPTTPPAGTTKQRAATGRRG
jgi:hypothetical protein